MSKVESLFKSKAIFRNDMMLFSKEHAIEFINACENHAYVILGIDAFHIFEDKIQPSLENSVDFSSNLYKQKTEDNISDAREFLSHRENSLVFEIVYRPSSDSD